MRYAVEDRYYKNGAYLYGKFVGKEKRTLEKIKRGISNFWHKNRSFLFKMSITFGMVITICFIVFGVILYQYSSRILRNQIIQDQKQALEQSADHISYIQDTLKMTAQSIAIASDVQTNVRMEKEGTYFEQLVRKKEMRTILGSYVMMLPYCEDIQIITENGTGYSSNNTENLYELEQSDWFSQWKDKKESMGYSRIHDYYNEQGQAHEQVISYIISFKDLTNLQNTLGYIIMHINLESILHADSKSGSPEGITLYNGDGEILAGSILSENYNQILSYGGENYTLKEGNVVLATQNMSYGWMLVTEVPHKFIENKIRPILELLVFFIILQIIIMCGGLYFVVWHYTKPVALLTQAANDVADGNLDIQLDIKSDDEFMLLGDTFNEMVVNIRQLLEESVAYERREKENEINRLMLQINPHFIYNTLNCIVYMAKLKKNEDIITYTNAFISLLQDTLRMDKDSIFVPLRQEMNNVRNYITLQEVRYPGIIHVKYQVDTDVLDLAVPNVFIQPIVENAIYHGLARKSEGGNLYINAFKENDTLKIIIEDNGAGMSEEKVKELLSEDNINRDGMRKIGIANVYNRIQHIYGENYGMTVESEEGKGTKITISMPAVLYER